jgi:hypothetical protein
VATVIGGIVLFVVTWLVTWAALMAVYLGVLAAVDLATASWRQYERRQKCVQAVAAELARIDRDASASVQRIGVAFLTAQKQLRERDNWGHP